MEIDKKLVGNRIKNLRLEKKLTQENLALLLGLNNKSSISQYENGSIIPSDDIKIKICDIFNCPMEYLMGISDERQYTEENSIDICIDEADIAFAQGIKGLNDTNKMIIKNTLEALLAKQEKDDKDKK